MLRRIVSEGFRESNVQKEWHKVRGDEEQGMCGREIAENAEELPDDA
ncbi:hypothetical protein AB0G54_24260 [Streptomyces yokosukanensis]|nr:hypothetical protein [Streptomyces yokosukanensis]